jgi:hypothetical protein
MQLVVDMDSDKLKGSGVILQTQISIENLKKR